MQLVKVVNIGHQYSMWIKKFDAYNISYGKYNQNSSPPLQKGKIYKIIDTFKHDISKNTSVCVIEDLQTKDRYLIGESGLEKISLIEFVASKIIQELI